MPKWQEEDSIIAHPYDVYSLSIETEVIEETTHCVHDHTLIFEHNTLHRETLANIRRNTALTALIDVDCLDDEIKAELYRRGIYFSPTNYIRWKDYLVQFRLEEALTFERHAHLSQSLSQPPRLSNLNQPHQSIRRFPQAKSYDQDQSSNRYHSLPVIPQAVPYMNQSRLIPTSLKKNIRRLKEFVFGEFL